MADLLYPLAETVDEMIVSGRKTWTYANRIWESFNRHSDGLLAAAISFYGMLSMAPLLSLGVAILGWVLTSERALNSVQEALTSYLPTSGTAIFETLAQIKQDTGIAGAIGIGGLLLSASAIFSNLELAFNNIWHAPVMRAWWRQRLVALGTTTLTLALFFSSIGITSAMTWLQNRRVPGLAMEAGDVPFLWQFLAQAVSLALTALMFTLIYKIIPNCPVDWRKAAAGGIFAGAAFEIAKYLFALYLAHFGNYNKVYGSLGAIVSLMIWAYYSSFILFLGAEIAADPGPDRKQAESPPIETATPQPRDPEN